jgi:hypothetical protein
MGRKRHLEGKAKPKRKASKHQDDPISAKTKILRELSNKGKKSKHYFS